MLTWSARTISPEALNEIFDGETGIEDTHPSLSERLRRLEESRRPPPPMARSAGQEILGVELQRVADALDEMWIGRNGEGWLQRRSEYVDRTETLDRLSAIETPTADERFKRAELVELLHGPDQALPIYQSAAEDGHPGASLAAGRLLLDRMDVKGVVLVEDAMTRDDSLTPAACGLLAQYYRETNQELAARKCEWRANRHSTRARLAHHGYTRSLLPGL
jgi:hypothetical protein